MKIAVTGGTGYIGSLLVNSLLQRGDEVTVISRSVKQMPHKSKLSYLTWAELKLTPSALEGIDAIVNLAGESINRRWNEAGKKAILQSRLDAAKAIEEICSALRRKPSVVVNASGISIYGTDGRVSHDEQTEAQGDDFLASVVEQWEAAADRIPVKRLVKLRVSLVLGMKNGAFPKMLLPYRFFAGGRIGSGKQWISWIHEDDMIALILFCIDNPEIEGPVNACAPEPLNNDDFGRALGAAANKPHWLPLPAFLLNILLGDMSFLLLEGTRAVPDKALKHGFTFRYPTAKAAFKHLFARD